MAECKPLTLTDIIGVCGKYQTVVYLLSFYSSFFMGTSVVTVELLAPMVTIYWDWDASNPNRTTFSSNDCKMDAILELNRTSNLSNQDARIIYESQYSKRTLTEELGMVCERSWLISFANFMCILGLCAGNIFLRFSEKYGRRPFIIVAACGCAHISICMSFTKGYVMFAICNFLFRACCNQAYVLLFIQAVELAPPSRAPYIGIYTKSGLLVAQTMFVGAAWILRNWFHAQLFQAALAVWYLIVIWYMLESPVWLAVRGRYEESRQVLVKIVQRNGLELQEAEPKINAWLDQMKVRCEIQSKAEGGRIADLFKNKTIGLYTLGMAFIAFAGTFVYSGLVMNAESFGSGLYLDLILSSVLSLVSVLIAGLFLKKVSIRVMLISCYFLAGLSCIAYPIAYSSRVARTTIAVLARFLITPVFAIAMNYTTEVFPTSIRGVGSGFVTFNGFLFSTLSPFTKELGEVTSVYVPFILFSILSLTSALIHKLLPETKGRPMLHTIDELKEYTSRSLKIEEHSTKL